MERKHIIGGAIAAGLALAIGLGFYFAGGETDTEEDAWETVPASRQARSRSSRSDDPLPPRARESAAPTDRPSFVPGDPAASAEAQEGEESLDSLRPPREDPDGDRSSGWRLGRARANIATLERRVARVREALANLEQRGDPALVERQRAVLARLEERMGELADEARALETQASGDGTIAEADQGYTDTFREERTVESEVPPAG